MKPVYFIITCLLLTGISFAQPMSNIGSAGGKIKLANDQAIVIESSTDIEASFSMGMEMVSKSIVQNSLLVKNSTDKQYTISNTFTKIKANLTMMGQPYNYDSENKESNNGDMAKIFDNSLNNPVDIIVDNMTGKAISEKKPVKKKDTDASNPATDLMKMFSDNSDEGIVSGAFEVIPPGRNIGDSWSDTTGAKDMKMIRKYTLSSISGNESTILLDAVSNAVNKLDFQGMEFEIKSVTKTKGEIVTDINTGLVKKRSSISDITGTVQMMGQDMPISAKVTSAGTYK
ncbi:MAG: hypothetical protein IPH68_10145 [Chitinophagaceae bacterium]|nr:hypothetical protein [Chitinophagaceae bacterium]